MEQIQATPGLTLWLDNEDTYQKLYELLATEPEVDPCVELDDCDVSKEVAVVHVTDSLGENFDVVVPDLETTTLQDIVNKHYPKSWVKVYWGNEPLPDLCRTLSYYNIHDEAHLVVDTHLRKLGGSSFRIERKGRRALTPSGIPLIVKTNFGDIPTLFGRKDTDTMIRQTPQTARFVLLLDGINDRYPHITLQRVKREEVPSYTRQLVQTLIGMLPPRWTGEYVVQICGNGSTGKTEIARKAAIELLRSQGVPTIITKYG